MGMTDIVVENEALFGRFSGRLNIFKFRSCFDLC